MSASGLIYAAIALMWAAVLIPMWLRNHDTASENRSVERFGQAMRVLSRREHAAQEERRHEGEERIETRSPEPAPAPRPRTQSRTARRTPKVPRRRPARPPLTLAQRRARTLGVLVAMTVLLVVATPLTSLPWWTPLPVAVLLVAFVVNLRVQEVQKQRRRGSGPARRPRTSSDARSRRKGEAHPRRRARPAAEEAPLEVDETASGFVSGPSRAVTVETKRHAASAAAPEQDDQAWQPNPLPLPTYVTAPKAVRPIKVIDLTTPGAWTSGRLLDDGLGEEDMLAAEVKADELDALLEYEARPPAESPGEESGDNGRRAVGD